MLKPAISVAKATLCHDPTGRSNDLVSDVVAIAKKPLAAGDMLDGEGGFTVWGRIARARDSLTANALPIGRAHKMKLKNAIPEGRMITWNDIEAPDTQAVRARRAMEEM